MKQTELQLELITTFFRVPQTWQPFQANLQAGSVANKSTNSMQFTKKAQSPKQEPAVEN